MSDIGRQVRLLEKQRRDRIKELMDEYDRAVYYPEMKRLRDLCGMTAEGHNQAKFHDNGLGWHWWYCGRCGAAHGKERYLTSFVDENEPTN